MRKGEGDFILSALLFPDCTNFWKFDLCFGKFGNIVRIKITKKKKRSILWIPHLNTVWNESNAVETDLPNIDSRLELRFLFRFSRKILLWLALFFQSCNQKRCECEWWGRGGAGKRVIPLVKILRKNAIKVTFFLKRDDFLSKFTKICPRFTSAIFAYIFAFWFSYFSSNGWLEFQKFFTCGVYLVIVSQPCLGNSLARFRLHSCRFLKKDFLEFRFPLIMVFIIRPIFHRFEIYNLM